jgi:putative DNA primase/helicase
VLHRLILEAVEYYKDPGPRGFPPCPAIDRETEEYIKSEDIIGQFLEERTVAAEDEAARAGELYGEYLDWAQSQGYRRTMDKNKFGKKLSERLERGHDRDGKYYLGIKIRGKYD